MKRLQIHILLLIVLWLEVENKRKFTFEKFRFSLKSLSPYVCVAIFFYNFKFLKTISDSANCMQVTNILSQNIDENWVRSASKNLKMV